MMSQPVLSAEGLTVGVGRRGAVRRIVDDICFTLARGERLALVGESGSGKSVTALALTGLLPRPLRLLTGRVVLEGEAYDPADCRRMRHLRGARIATVFQDPGAALDPVMTVGAHVAEAVHAHAPLTPRELRARVIELLEQVRISDPEARLGAWPHEFSGGMRQRVMIACALAHDPAVLIADEPTTALDVVTQAEILRLMDELCRRRGTALLLITHDLTLVRAFCDTALVMKDGCVRERGRAAKVLAEPQDPYTRALLAAVPPIDRDVAWLGVAPASAGAIASPCPAVLRSRADAPEEALPVLRVENVTLGYGSGPDTVRGVSLSIPRGKVLGLVGKSGSGKTTLSRAILGLLAPRAGRIEVFGDDIAGHDRRAANAMRRKVQMVFQDPYTSLDPMMSIGRIVAEPLVVHRIGTPESRRDRAASLLAQVGLPDTFLSRLPAQLSGGQRQRVAVARALALEPDLLLCDEPVSALDVSVQAEVLNMLKRLTRETGQTMLFISHDLAVVRFIADEIAVIHAGEIVEQGPKTRILDAPANPYTRSLIAASRLAG